MCPNPLFTIVLVGQSVPLTPSFFSLLVSTRSQAHAIAATLSVGLMANTILRLGNCFGVPCSRSLPISFGSYQFYPQGGVESLLLDPSLVQSRFSSNPTDLPLLLAKTSLSISVSVWLHITACMPLMWIDC